MRVFASLCLSLGLPLPALAQDGTPAPPDARVYFVMPADGMRVGSPVTVCFGLVGMGVSPAGVENQNTGHHHLLIDVAELPPGARTLQLVLGDHDHVPHDPPIVSERITITVD